MYLLKVPIFDAFTAMYNVHCINLVLFLLHILYYIIQLFTVIHRYNYHNNIIIIDDLMSTTIRCVMTYSYGCTSP